MGSLSYFRNERLHAKERPLLLSECGGYTRSIKGHLYNPNVRYGYGRTETEINGFYTYDRQVCKVNQNALRRMSLDVYKARAEEG